MIRRPPRSTLFPYTRSSDLSVIWNGRRAGSGTRSVTDFGPDASRTELTTPPGGGVPGGRRTTSASFTHATVARESRSRTWSFQRPDSTATVPVGKNQLYVPWGTVRPGERPSVVPVRAVSSSKTMTVGKVISTTFTLRGQRAVAVSPPTLTASVAHAVRPSAHSAAAGSQPT